MTPRGSRARHPRTWQDNADELRELDHKEGWPFGILVACSVELNPDGGRPKTVPNGTVSASAISDPTPNPKVSAREFARRASTSPGRVLRYLARWEAAAALDLVPAADKLVPDDVRTEGLPEIPWSSIPLPDTIPAAPREPRESRTPEATPEPSPTSAAPRVVTDPRPESTPPAPDLPDLPEAPDPTIPPLIFSDGSSTVDLPVSAPTPTPAPTTDLARLARAIDPILTALQTGSVDDWRAFAALPEWGEVSDAVYTLNNYMSRINEADAATDGAAL